MSFDFQSIFDTEDPIYVHSNSSNFQNAFSGISFEEILDTIAANLTTVLESNIRMLESMEEQMVKNQLKKYKNAGVKADFEDKEGFLNYFRAFKKRMDEQKKLETYTFVKFKESQNFAKKIVEGGVEVGSQIMTDIFNQNSRMVKKLAKEKRQKRNSSSRGKKAKEERQSDLRQAAETLQKSANELEKLFPQLLSIMVTQLVKVYDPTRGEKPETGDQTSAQRVLKRITNIIDITKEVTGKDGVKKVKIKTAKEIEVELKKYMEEQGSLTFFSQFLEESHATKFFKAIIDDQINTPLGELYEPAIVNSIKKFVIQEAKNNIIPFFDSDKIRATGRIGKIKNVSTADFVFDDMESGGFKTFFSASVKLVAPDSKIKSETQSKDLWDSLIRFIGKEKANQISYIRQNVLSIPSYAADEKEEKFLSLDLQKLKDFDQKIFTLLGAARLFIGFFEVIDNQIRSFGLEDNSFYFVVYLYEAKNIYRSTDILKAIVEQLKTNFKSNFFNVTIGGSDMMNTAEYPEPSRDSLKNLYEAKLKSMKNARRKSQQSTYKTLLNDNDVIRELKTINQIIGKHPFEKGFQMTPTITLKQVSDKFK